MDARMAQHMHTNKRNISHGQNQGQKLLVNSINAEK
jgi:hypothetical protein